MQSENTLNTLSARESQVFKLIAEGYKNKEIAEKLGISVETVKSTVCNLYDKLGVDDRLEAALLYIKLHPERLPELAPAGK